MRSSPSPGSRNQKESARILRVFRPKRTELPQKILSLSLSSLRLFSVGDAVAGSNQALLSLSPGGISATGRERTHRPGPGATSPGSLALAEAPRNSPRGRAGSVGDLPLTCSSPAPCTEGFPHIHSCVYRPTLPLSGSLFSPGEEYLLITEKCKTTAKWSEGKKLLAVPWCANNHC